MKRTLKITLFFLLTTIYTKGQSPDILDYKEISVNGINWKSNESDLIREFGKADSTYNPNFECGAYSTDQQNIKKVLLYHYKNIDFLVVDNHVVFQDIYFDNKNSIELKTNSLTLSYKTTIEKLKNLFPKSYQNWLNDEYGVFRLWPCENCDSEIWLYIENDHIKQIKFWDPC